MSVLLIASKVRIRADHRRLDTKTRLAIQLKPHHIGTYVTFVDPKNGEAQRWVQKHIDRHGTLHWERTGKGPSARYGWVVKKPDKDAEAV